ncbi:hypothetical protein SARC_06855 [Sphaeroforma arctica JP610]|uniref:Uncharacterized protein n=1 Tax=Sphaeroforma arctica JP610 TaxID=667725 RepID=A0A0L0FVD3_9EUKA|nr:hypothetical protein SARC_06855 [Sphaeroforma arctica JP610]KNC80792.1 hypothetical protein SARC_06855 [Sphaeroforma arctica JP610]|eukprot:XP_014154694.1 hypothetical protein SARC_06855 [Sphaeroforma arctica JP610]
MYLSHAHAQLIAANAIEPIVAFVARVLSMPSDSAGTLVGRLIIKLVKKVDLGEYMLPMLNTALQKLSSVSFILYEQTLVVMFAQMMLADLSWCLGFLTSQTVDVVSGNTPYLSPVGVNHKGETVTRTVSGFELVMAKWVESQQMFSGRFDVNTALVALSQLCSSTDPAVQKLLNEELLHRQYEQEQGSDGWEEDGSGDEDDGEDGWEDAPSGKNSSPFAPASDYTNLSDALFSGGLMDDVDDQVVEDPEILKDPLFKLDIKVRQRCA